MYKFSNAPGLGKTPFWSLRRVAVEYLADIAYAAIAGQMGQQRFNESSGGLFGFAVGSGGFCPPPGLSHFGLSGRGVFPAAGGDILLDGFAGLGGLATPAGGQGRHRVGGGRLAAGVIDAGENRVVVARRDALETGGL